jgi:ribosomal protein S18 acetylase RimI-like enzyme
MSTAPATLHKLSTGDRRAAARALAAAFHGDPLFAWLVPSETGRLGWLERFMGASLKLIADHGQTWVAPGRDGADDVAALITVVGPGRYPPPRLRELAFLGRLLPRLLLGQPRPARASAGLKALARVDAVHPDVPHWYLFQLAVHPDHQARGLGRAIVEHALAYADAEGLPAYLETSNPANLDFYERFGFAVQTRIEHGEVPPIWTMLRESR